jgi:hypothetical protein
LTDFQAKFAPVGPEAGQSPGTFGLRPGQEAKSVVGLAVCGTPEKALSYNDKEILY